MVAPRGFIAPTSGSRHGVLVLHPWWGLNDTVKAFCGRLATHGFLVFAPDLFDGRVANTIRDAETLSRSIDPEQARAKVAAAAVFLLERVAPAGRSLAVIGFSFGAWFALEISVTDPEPYPGTGHWFFEPDRTDAFHPAAAELAWDRTLAFLRRVRGDSGD